MTNTPKIGLVTVLYNAPDVLPDFFESLAVQAYKHFQLYVVDNSNQPEPLALARTLAEQHGIATTFIDNQGHNVGVAAGNNQGARAAYADQCDYLLFINNDLLFLSPDILSELVQVAQSDQLAMVSPLILNYPEKKIWYAGGTIDESRGISPHFNIDADYQPGQVERASYSYAPTCFLLVSRTLWQQVGEMDERYFVYYDDTDFLYRASQLGYRVELIPSCVIYHKVGSSTGGDISYFGMYHLTRNRIYFIRKNISAPRRYLALLYTCGTRLVRLVSASQMLRTALVKGMIDGFKM